jgi:hypothetical protein
LLENRRKRFFGVGKHKTPAIGFYAQTTRKDVKECKEQRHNNSVHDDNVTVNSANLMQDDL